jgi:hypothetical protein
MWPVMNAATVRSSSSALIGRLVALLAAAAFLMAGMTGNAFSLHVGMTTMTSSAAAPVTADFSEPNAATTATSLAVADVAGDDPVTAETPASGSADGQRLMHLLGACLAVIAAAVALLALRSLCRLVGGSCTGIAARPVSVVPFRGGVWSPPPLSPPSVSPVIRT